MRTLAFILVRQVLGLIGLSPTPDARDLEIAVLRGQLMVLNREGFQFVVAMRTLFGLIGP